jgi:hypothetical protein
MFILRARNLTLMDHLPSIMAQQKKQACNIETENGSYAGEDHLEYVDMQHRVDLVAEPERSADAPRHNKKYDKGKFDKEFHPAGVNVAQAV